METFLDGDELQLKFSIIDNLIRFNYPDKALKKIRSLNITTESAPYLFMIQFLKGRCYSLKQNEEKAKKHYLRSIQLIDKSELDIDKSNIKPSCLNELGRIAFYENDLKQALEYTNQAIEAIKPEDKRAYMQYTCYINKAIYLEQLNHKEAASRILDFLWSKRDQINNLDVVLNTSNESTYANELNREFQQEYAKKVVVSVVTVSVTFSFSSGSASFSASLNSGNSC